MSPLQELLARVAVTAVVIAFVYFLMTSYSDMLSRFAGW